MLLKSLVVNNFRCFAELPPIPLHRLTVFIGENDAGKTAILDAIEILLTTKTPSPSDFKTLVNGQVVDTMMIGGTLDLEDFDTLPDDYRSAGRREFIIRKTFTTSSMTCEVEGRDFADPRWSIFQKQPAAVQKELLQTLGIEPASNAEQRVSQFREALSAGLIPKVASVVEVRFQDLVEYLPRFEKISSTDYHHPDTMVQRTLQAVVDGFLRPENPETGERELRPELQDLKVSIKGALDAKVAQIYGSLHRANPRLVSIQVSPSIDFSRSVTAVNLMVDAGEGPRLVSSFGEGTKKKLWMGLLDWERQTQQELRDISVIRAYDEPDVNLDYTAERKLFANIIESTSEPGSRTQAIVCTHAVTLVDRAPGKSINLITVTEDGTRAVRYLHSDSDADVEAFLTTIGRSVGLTNSALFYERAFLTVEGESEENALPILYRNLYGRSLIEDGIVLINLHTCGAWKAILGVLQRHKQDITVMLLDQDCTSYDSSARVTLEALAEIGYPNEFIASSCFYIGTKEFEDAFSTSDIVAVLNSSWPKDGSVAWEPNDVDQFRHPDRKFSEDLLEHVRRTCVRPRRNFTHKPEFAQQIAIHCTTEAQIPPTIRSVFEELRRRSGCYAA